MASRRRSLPLLAALSVSFVVFVPALAEKPAWTPIAELLVGSIGNMDPTQMSDVMTRCTGLTMTLVSMAADFSPETSERYKDEARKFIQNGVLIDSRLEKERTGVDADIDALSNATIAKVKEVVSGYNAWMDDNVAATDSYIDKDIELEMSSCRLASRLLAQVSIE